MTNPLIDRLFADDAPDASSDLPPNAPAQERTEAALRLAVQYGYIDGDHHKMWVIDQMVRALIGQDYETLIDRYSDGEDGPDTYQWDEGIAP